MDNFFKHENHAYPPSLLELGKLRLGTKADLTDCLEKLSTSEGEAPPVDAVILDGAAIINMLRPVGAKTFQERNEVRVSEGALQQPTQFQETGRSS